MKRLWLLPVFSMIGSAHTASDYDLTPSPENSLEINGTIPGSVEIEVKVTWQTTVVNDDCAPRQPWPVGVRFPKHVSFPVPLEHRSGQQRTWKTWRDLLTEGKCGWTLASIDFVADSSKSAFFAHATSLVPSRIAFACLNNACPGNSGRMNDDPAEPVTQYCKFSLLERTDARYNPCVFAADGKFSGASSIPFKEQHILKPGQKIIQFSIIDVDPPASLSHK